MSLHRFRALSAPLLVAVAGVAFAPLADAKTSSPLKASMSGRSEVPKGDLDGSGSARITLDRSRGRVCYAITMTKTGTVGAGHIHAGKAGVAGAIVIPLFDKPTRAPRGCVGGVSKSLIAKVQGNPSGYYVNVHNAAHPAGALRGQLRR